jgi:hypothetical protein
MLRKQNYVLRCLVAIFSLAVATASNQKVEKEEQSTTDNKDVDFLSFLAPPATSDLEEALSSSSSSSKSCGFVLARSAIPQAGWGVFSLAASLYPRDKILWSDLRIQLVDVQSHQYAGLAHLIENYSWGAKYGRYEGTEVQSIRPGLSMLANTGWDGVFHAIPSLTDAPEPGNHTTRTSPHAGSFTYYHNRQFYAKQAVRPGDEILVSYGTNFIEQRLKDAQKRRDLLNNLKKPLQQLQQDGLCLDHIASAPAKEKGKGAFATRFLPKDSVIAPLPVLPVNRTSLLMDENTQQQQLLLNYLYGHPNSTLLLFPYAPVVNYINSADHNDSSQRANAIIRWSTQHAFNLEQSFKMSAQQILSSRRWGLLLEVVALRDIQAGEEILIDYGDAWHKAWANHVASFQKQQQQPNHQHVYPSRLNRLATVRTVSEQEQNPYPENVKTACMYQHNERANHPLWPYSLAEPHKKSKKQQTYYETTYSEFDRTQRLVPDFLRPCRILARSETQEGGNSISSYTVQVGNPNSAAVGSEGRIPAKRRHVVTNVPRQAILFVDKTYATDQYLQDAFRHEIGLPERVFPTTWMDLNHH